ncbi:MAG: four helix bundle protein [Acidobacteria bacterium]|nr:four helix bundle protein [Acidobacteriota bacterium]
MRRGLRSNATSRSAIGFATRLRQLLENIAEGLGRRSHADFARLLDVARGSLAECQNHLQDAVDRGYLSHKDFVSLHALADRACGAVAGLQRYLRKR